MPKIEKSRNSAAPTEKKFVPSIPGVNVIPQEVINHYNNKNLIVTILVVLSLVIVSLGGLKFYDGQQQIQREKELSAIEAETALIKESIAELIPYFNFYQDVDKKRTTLGENMAMDLNYAELITLINAAASENGILLDSINVVTAITTGTPPNCTSPDPFNPNSGIGCVRFSGNAQGRDNIANFINSLNEIPGLSNAYIPGSNASGVETTEVNSISGNVSFDGKFYTNRFSELSVPLGELTGITVVSDSEDAPEDLGEDNDEIG